MPPLPIVVVSLLMLSPPTYAIVLLLSDTNTRPKHRTTRALGSSIIMKSLIMMSLCFISLSLEQRWSLSLPLLMGFFICIIALRIMKIEDSHHLSPTYYGASQR